VATLVIGLGTPGSANVISRSDGNDTKGPLDLGGLKVSHVSGGSLFVISTLAAFTNKEVNGDNGFFQVGIDTNADQRLNYYIDVFFASGRYRGVLFKPSGAVITYNLRAARVSPKAVKVTLPHSRIAQQGSYDFLIFSVYFGTPCAKKNPCVDAIPNRYPLIRHDFTPPTIAWTKAPQTYNSDASNSLVIPIRFKVSENTYGSGLKNWTVWRRDAGSSTWVKSYSGGVPSANADYIGTEGAAYDFRAIATDHQGNKTTSAVFRSNEPWDDRNALFTYSAANQTIVADAFLNTVSYVSSGETVTFSVPTAADDVCIVGGPSPVGTVGVSVSNLSSEVLSFSEDTTTPMRTRFCLGYSVPSGYALSLTLSSGTEPFTFDGLIVSR